MAKITEAQRQAFYKIMDEFTEERIREIIRDELKKALVVSADKIERAIIEHIRMQCNMG